MSGRFGFNIRPAYDEDEETSGERLHRGISGALDSILQQRAQNQDFRNKARAIDPAAQFSSSPTPLARVMSRFGRTASGRHLQGAQAPAADPASLPTFSTDASGRPVARPGAPSIGDALRTEIEGPNGQRASVDPYAQRRGEASIEVGTAYAKADAEARAKARYDPPLTFDQRKELARVRPGSTMTQQDRVEIEKLRQQGRVAIQALIGGRGNSAAQLQAAKAVQASLDGKVRALQTELQAARRAYDDDRVSQLLEELEEARNAADEHRDALSGVVAPRQRRSSDEPEPQATREGRRNRMRQAPRSAPHRPARTPAETRVVPPPIRP